MKVERMKLESAVLSSKFRAGRPKRPKVDGRKTRCGPKDSKWTFRGTNMDGFEIKNERPEEPE